MKKRVLIIYLLVITLAFFSFVVFLVNAKDVVKSGNDYVDSSDEGQENGNTDNDGVGGSGAEGDDTENKVDSNMPEKGELLATVYICLDESMNVLKDLLEPGKTYFFNDSPFVATMVDDYVTPPIGFEFSPSNVCEGYCRVRDIGSTFSIDEEGCIECGRDCYFEVYSADGYIFNAGDSLCYLNTSDLLELSGVVDSYSLLPNELSLEVGVGYFMGGSYFVAEQVFVEGTEGYVAPPEGFFFMARGNVRGVVRHDSYFWGVDWIVDTEYHPLEFWLEYAELNVYYAEVYHSDDALYDKSCVSLKIGAYDAGTEPYSGLLDDVKASFGPLSGVVVNSMGINFSNSMSSARGTYIPCIMNGGEKFTHSFSFYYRAYYTDSDGYEVLEEEYHRIDEDSCLVIVMENINDNMEVRHTYISSETEGGYFSSENHDLSKIWIGIRYGASLEFTAFRLYVFENYY